MLISVRDLRQVREAHGLTQAALGDLVGVTFQQIQKYEKGTNRVSAGGLFDLAECLKVPIGTFFVGLEGTCSSGAVRRGAS